MFSAVSCSKKADGLPMGVYSFGDIYLYIDGSLVNLHELEIILPNEEGFTDLEVMSGKLESVNSKSKNVGVLHETTWRES